MGNLEFADMVESEAEVGDGEVVGCDHWSEPAVLEEVSGVSPEIDKTVSETRAATSINDTWAIINNGWGGV